MNHYALGWSEVWDPHLEQYEIENMARIIARHKHVSPALTAGGDKLNLYMPGKLLSGYAVPVLSPVVGDWCVCGERFLDESNQPSAIIESILPRRTAITRAGAGLTSDHQVLAANVDVMFIMTSINRDLNINRLRRYLLLAQQGGVRPVIVLSKIDLLDETSMEGLNDLDETLPDVHRIYASTVTGTGLAEIRSLLRPGSTSVFIGSSGVGKSTLVNALMEAVIQKTGDIRESDQRGRHTTSGSELFFVADGGMLIDTAGLKGVGVVGDDESLVELMPTVVELAQACRFADCTHQTEPGCAVQAALDSGFLPQSEWNSYSQLSRELAYSRRKTDQRLVVEERKRWKQVAINQRRMKKQRPNII